MKYQCCWALNDPESWTEVEAHDRELAAARFAELLCARQNESYSVFAGGEIVLVKVAGGAARAFEVIMETLPHFSARPRL
jgi:hypothetical protein